MIRVHCYKDARDRWLGLSVSGHTGLAVKGGDVLCSAVSTLTENLEAGLQILLEIKASIKKEDGYHKIQIKESEANDYSQLLFSSAILGLHILDKNHPGLFSIVEELSK